MAIALAQSLSGSSSTPNPTATFSKRVGAGSCIIVTYVYAAGTPAADPTDTRGNVYELAGFAQQDAQTLCALYYAWNVAAGTTTITIPTNGPSAWAIHEFSGVLATSDPGADGGGMSADAPTLSIPYTVSQAGELFFAVEMSTANIAITTPAGITLAQTVQSANGSLKTAWLTPSAVGAGTVSFPGTTSAPCALFWLALLHA